MDFTIWDKVRRVFMTKKGFVIYMLDKNANEMKAAAKISKKRTEDAKTAIAAALEQKNNTQAENHYLDTRKLEIEIKLEALKDEYQSLVSKRKVSDPATEANLANTIEELVEEQVRVEAQLAHNNDTLAGYMNRIRDIRRSFAEMEGKTKLLEAQVNDIETRRKLVAAMESTQVALTMIESSDVSDNAKVANAILEATERQQGSWAEDRKNASKNTEEAETVRNRVNAILGDERKAIK